MKTKLLLSTLVCGLTSALWAQSPKDLLPMHKQRSVSSNSLSVCDSLYSFSWSPAQNNWSYSQKIIFGYNTYGKANNQEFYQYDFGGWQPLFRQTNYQFDSQHNCTEWTAEQFNNNSWTASGREQFTYDTANHLTTDVFMNYNSGVWQNNEQWLYTYSNNNITSRTHQKWNLSASAWENDERLSYNYNTSDQVVSTLFEHWKAGAWQNWTRTLNYIYSGNDLTSNESEQWDTLSSSFRPYGQIVYTYDGNHHVTNEHFLNWDASTGTWVNFTQFDYTFDANGNWSSHLMRIWDAGSNTWKNSSKTLYYYSTAFTSLGEQAVKNGLGASPNPASSFVEIKSTHWPANIRISDLSGKVFISEQLQNANAARIDMTSLAPGLYLLDITTETGHFNEKIIKQ